MVKPLSPRQEQFDIHEPLQPAKEVKKKPQTALFQRFINTLSKFSLMGFHPFAWLSKLFQDVVKHPSQSSTKTMPKTTIKMTDTYTFKEPAHFEDSVLPKNIPKRRVYEPDQARLQAKKSALPEPMEELKAPEPDQAKQLVKKSALPEPMAQLVERPAQRSSAFIQVAYLKKLADTHSEPETIRAICNFIEMRHISLDSKTKLANMLALLIREHLDTLLADFIHYYPLDRDGPAVLKETQSLFTKDSTEHLFLQRIHDSIQSISSLDKFYHNLNSVQIFRIAAFAEFKIRQGGQKEVEHERKWNRQGRSLIIDYANKEWTILSKSKKGVNFLLVFGGEKKVTSGIEVRDAGHTVEVVATPTNKPGVVLSPYEIAISQEIKATKKTRGLAVLRAYTEYTSKTLQPKQTFVQTQYIESAYDILVNPAEVRAKKKIQFPNFTPNDIMKLGVETAIGLTTLHELGYCHGDLKLENVLARYLNGVWEFAISDYGFAFKPKEPGARAKAPTYGTTCFSAPEIIENMSYTHRDGFTEDVYAFGTMLYIAKNIRMPPWYTSYNNAAKATTYADRQAWYNDALRLQKGFAATITQWEASVSVRRMNNICTSNDEFTLLIHQCLHPNPALRPPMSEVLKRMQIITKTA